MKLYYLDIESTCSEGESENDLIRAKEKKLKKRSCVAQLKEKMATSTVASLESGTNSLYL